MVTGFDIWGHDAGLRRHWKGRFAAFAIDALMIFVPVPLILYLFGVTDIFTVGLTLSVGFYIFSAVTETLAGATVGKRLMGLSVHPVKGEGLGGRACVRNLGRLLWFALPPLDFAIGMSMRGDPRQTMLDHAAGTVVMHAGEQSRYDAQVEAAGKAAAQADAAACRECGGRLLILPDQKMQCERCGLIQ